MTRPLLEIFPRLQSRLPLAVLGDYPTPVQPIGPLYSSTDRRLDCAFIKRDDLSSPIYGGNKVRTLEFLFGAALSQGRSRIYSLGAFGSNHALATTLHGPRVGLETGALLFPQPWSGTAADNIERVAGLSDDLVCLSHWSALPWALWTVRRRLSQSRVSADFMAPGGATAFGAMGYISAALELAEQIQRRELPSPDRIILPVGSTCTTAGLLVGLRVAQRLGLAFQQRLPQIVAIRVSPWPVTSRFRIVSLARRAARQLADWVADPSLAFTSNDLSAGLTIDTRFLGTGYGRPTPQGLEAIRRFGTYGATGLDTTYSAKAAAALVQLLEEKQCPTLYWATKSSAALPPVTAGHRRPPAKVQRWLLRGRRLD